MFLEAPAPPTCVETTPSSLNPMKTIKTLWGRAALLGVLEKMSCISREQEEKEQNYKKDPTRFLRRKPFGKRQVINRIVMNMSHLSRCIGSRSHDRILPYSVLFCVFAAPWLALNGQTVSVNGLSATTASQSPGNGGRIEIRYGVSEDLGDEGLANPDLTGNSVTLQSGTYIYSNVLANTIYINGNVTIKCRYIFSPQVIMAAPGASISPTLTLMVGIPANLVSAGGLGQAYLAGSSAQPFPDVDLSPHPPAPYNHTFTSGGSLTFLTPSYAEFYGSPTGWQLYADGGNAATGSTNLNGGSGGTIFIQLPDTPGFAFGTLEANGGNGVSPTPQQGGLAGNGGNGGLVEVTARQAPDLDAVTILGGDGGVGYSGTNGIANSPNGQNGGSGGEGGAGGTFQFDQPNSTVSLPGVILNISGGNGGAGGKGGNGYFNTTIHGSGGIGGNGGSEGAPGVVYGYVVPNNTCLACGTGGSGGNAGTGASGPGVFGGNGGAAYALNPSFAQANGYPTEEVNPATGGTGLSPGSPGSVTFFTPQEQTTPILRQECLECEQLKTVINSPPTIPFHISASEAYGWDMDVALTASDGVSIQNLKLNGRLLAASVSLPYLLLRSTSVYGSNGFSSPVYGPGSMPVRLEVGSTPPVNGWMDGTPVDWSVEFDPTETPWNEVLGPDPLVIKAVFALTRLGEGCVKVTQKYVFYPDYGATLEPSGNLDGNRFKPVVEYEFMGCDDEILNSIETIQALQFDDSGQSANYGIFTQDSLNGCLPNQVCPVPSGAEPLPTEYLVHAITNGAAGDADAYHQSFDQNFDLPGVIKTKNGFQFPALYGCERCVHMHWRWGASVDATYALLAGSGFNGPNWEDSEYLDNPIIPFGSTQSVDVAVTANGPGIWSLDPFDFRALVNGESVMGQPLTFWYAGRSSSNSDSFFNHGLFYQSSLPNNLGDYVTEQFLSEATVNGSTIAYYRISAGTPTQIPSPISILLPAYGNNLLGVSILQGSPGQITSTKRLGPYTVVTLSFTNCFVTNAVLELNLNSGTPASTNAFLETTLSAVPDMVQPELFCGSGGVTVQGLPGLVLDVQVSTDLKAWLDFTNLTLMTNVGPQSVSALGPGRALFFRAKIQ
jgi:hypothetical protein